MSVTLSQVFVMVGISDQVVAGLTGTSQSPTALLLIIMGIVLATGLFLEATPAMLILTPLFAPLVAQIGMSPVHFGVVMVMGLSIGFITPPMGLNLFVASAIGNTSIHKIARHALPYAVALVLVWLVVALVPPLALAFL